MTEILRDSLTDSDWTWTGHGPGLAIAIKIIILMRLNTDQKYQNYSWWKLKDFPCDKKEVGVFLLETLK